MFNGPWFSRNKRKSGGTNERRTPVATRARRRRPLVFAPLEERVLLTDTPSPTISSTPEAPQILLTPTVLSHLQQIASANTSQWQAFRANLDQGLDSVVSSGYDGAYLQYIANYALGYQALKASDPTAADMYADKAIAVLKSALNDYQIADWDTRQFLSRGDGSTATFTLPNSDIIPSSLHVYISPVTTESIVHGAANGLDNIGYYNTVLNVSNSPDGSPDYVQGSDWQRFVGDYDENILDWSPAGAEPASGATYYVTSASLSSTTPTAFTLNGNQITLATPPSANQAVYVEYVYGTHAADGSTLAYQQTSAGDGGFDSVFPNTTYPARYLGAYTAIGLDWLDGYSGMTMALKTETVDMLERWSSFLQTSGYQFNYPMSNYGAGSYFSNALTAVALEGRSSDASTYMSEVLDWRTQNLLPALTNNTTSLDGGFWAEGWSYGALSVADLLLGSLALEAGGYVNAAAEHHWATQVMQQLLSDQPSPNTIYDGGDVYTYPTQFPPFYMIDILSQAADDPTTRSYANYVLQNYSGQYLYAGADYLDILFRDPAATASYWSSLPLQNLASGTGLLTVRSDWSSSPDWASIQMGNLLMTNHQTYAPGQVQIQRGADDLLINANAPGEEQTPQTKSTYSNIVVVNANGDVDSNGYPIQTYPNAMGFWYGTPGVVINAYESGSNYVYLDGSYAAAYSPANAPGSGGPVSELTRQFVYLRPDLVLVYDRATTLKDTYSKQQQWMFLNAPTVAGNSFVESVGSSKLFGTTYSTVPLTTTTAPVTVGSATVQQLITQNASSTASVRYATAFQIAPSTTGSMDASQQILSTDSQLQGIEIGGYVVLFGQNGDVNTSSPLSYQVTSGGSLSHLITNLPVGQNYLVTVNGAAVAVVKASSQGTIHFTTSGTGTQTITISETTLSPQSPLAANDQYTLSGATTVVDAAHGVLANDTDPNGLALTATLQTPPQHGFVTFNPDGSFTYTAGADFSGSDSFTYVASDGQNTSAPATVTLTAAPPSAVNEMYVISKSSSSSVDAAHGVLAGDSNPSSGTLTAVLQTGPQHGTLTLNSDGSFTYTPDHGFSGVDSFTYVAMSYGQASNVATVTLLSQPAGVIRKLYQEVLLRDPDLGGLAYWTGLVDKGVYYSQIAQAILESDERLSRLIGQFYQQYLLRAADPAGLAYWEGVWRNDGGPQNVEAGIVGSPEFYSSSGATSQGWVTALYQRLLGRAPDTQGLTYWTNKLDSGDLTRGQIVLGFVRSPESFSNAVSNWFNEYLGRPVDTQTLHELVGVMQLGVSDRAIELMIIGSPEYSAFPAAPASGTMGRLS